MCLLCSCKTSGTVLLGRKCVQQSACLADTSRCSGPGQTCKDFSDGTYNCICIEGYEGNATSCALIDNCRKENVNCGQGNCENILNGFQCRCPEGYRFSNNTCVPSIIVVPSITTSISPENKNCVHLMLSHSTFWHTVRNYLFDDNDLFILCCRALYTCWRPGGSFGRTCPRGSGRRLPRVPPPLRQETGGVQYENPVVSSARDGVWSYGSQRQCARHAVCRHG